MTSLHPAWHGGYVEYFWVLKTRTGKQVTSFSRKSFTKSLLSWSAKCWIPCLFSLEVNRKLVKFFTFTSSIAPIENVLWKFTSPQRTEKHGKIQNFGSLFSSVQSYTGLAGLCTPLFSGILEPSLPFLVLPQSEVNLHISSMHTCASSAGLHLGNWGQRDTVILYLLSCGKPSSSFQVNKPKSS